MNIITLFENLIYNILQGFERILV